MRMVLDRRTVFALILAIGLLQTACHYLAGALVRSDGGMAIPQTDTLLYCQAAKRIVEGFPLSFSPGTAASTGTTSYAYPFMLAIPYALGFKGDSLIRAGFFLNGIFYLVFLFGWGVVIDRKLKGNLARLVGVVTIACLGQTAYSAFAQSDIGMWLAVSALLAAGLVLRNRWIYGTILVIGPWVRPEGIVCTIAFVMILCIVLFRCRLRLPCGKNALECSRLDVVIALAALMSVVGVFAANMLIAGHVQFSSIAHKGHFKVFPFAHAVFSTSIDMLKLLKGLILGIPAGSPRDFYSVPVIGAGLMWFGILSRDWRNADWREFVWLLAIFGGILTVAQSGWQNTNIDRYIGWVLPTVLLFAAEGAGLFAARFERLPASWLPAVLLCVFAVCTMPLFACMLHMTSGETDLLRAFAVNCEKVMEPGKTIGTWGDCGIVYEMHNRKVAHLGGIYSPEYDVKEQPFGVYEILKHNPEMRFDYLFYNPAVDGVDMSFNPLDAFCSQVLVGPYGYELRKMDWACFDAAARPPGLVGSKMTLRDRVDVGHDVDEQTHAYENIPLYDQAPLPPFVVWGDCGGAKIIEVARLVTGSDAMNVKLEAGKDVRVVVRMWPSHKATVHGGFGTRSVTYGFSNPLKIRLIVNGEDSGVRNVMIKDKGFTDVEMTVSGDMIKEALVRMEFQGDHIACAYWFYQ